MKRAKKSKEKNVPRLKLSENMEWLGEDVKEVLDSLVVWIGENVEIIFDDNYKWASVRSDSLRGTLKFDASLTLALLSLDHRSCYNKESQCPIVLEIPCGKRKLDRLENAIKFLLTKEGMEASNTFDFGDYFEEFSSDLRDIFYEQYY